MIGPSVGPSSPFLSSTASISPPPRPLQTFLFSPSLPLFRFLPRLLSLSLGMMMSVHLSPLLLGMRGLCVWRMHDDPPPHLEVFLTLCLFLASPFLFPLPTRGWCGTAPLLIWLPPHSPRPSYHASPPSTTHDTRAAPFSFFSFRLLAPFVLSTAPHTCGAAGD